MARAAYGRRLQQPHTTLDDFYRYSPAWQRLVQYTHAGLPFDPEEDVYRDDSAGADETVALTTVLEYLAASRGKGSLSNALFGLGALSDLGRDAERIIPRFSS